MQFLETYLDSKRLLGSDYSRVLKSKTKKGIEKEINLLNDSINKLKSIKPYLNYGLIEIKIFKKILV